MHSWMALINKEGHDTCDGVVGWNPAVEGGGVARGVLAIISMRISNTNMSTSGAD